MSNKITNIEKYKEMYKITCTFQEDADTDITVEKRVAYKNVYDEIFDAIENLTITIEAPEFQFISFTCERIIND